MPATTAVCGLSARYWCAARVYHFLYLSVWRIERTLLLVIVPLVSFVLVWTIFNRSSRGPSPTQPRHSVPSEPLSLPAEPPILAVARNDKLEQIPDARPDGVKASGDEESPLGGVPSMPDGAGAGEDRSQPQTEPREAADNQRRYGYTDEAGLHWLCVRCNFGSVRRVASAWTVFWYQEHCSNTWRVAKIRPSCHF